MLDTISSEPTTEVIVVDNGSTNDEASVIAQRYPWVKVVRSPENLGFAGGNNLGIKASSGRYLFFVNNDTEFPKDQGDHPLEPLIQRLASDTKIGVVCPKIRFAWGSHPIQFTGYTPLSPITMRNHSIGFGEEDNGQYDNPHPTPYAHGAAMMVKREAIERAGLMPECFFLYYEELDWSMMIRRSGFDIWFEPHFTIYHKESQATGQDSPLKTYYITRNRLLFARRNTKFPVRWLTYFYLMVPVFLRDFLKHTLRHRNDLRHATTRGISDFIHSRYGQCFKPL